MPRQAHGRPVQAGKPNRPAKRRAGPNRRLNALEIAEQELPDEVTIPQHRLGQIEDDSDDPRGQADADERSSKRRKVSNTQEDESDSGGSDLDGNRWHVGVDDEDEDSDIDSEEAFGESDEEKFADFTFRGTTSAPIAPRPRKVPKALDLEETESTHEENDSNFDEAEDDFGDEGVDLATAWDMDDQEQEETSRKTRERKSRSKRDEKSDRSTSASDEESASDVGDDAESQLSVSDDEGDHSRLQDFVHSLAPGTKAALPKKRQSLQGLPDVPSQFGLSSTKISAADLMQYVKDPRQRQSLKILQNSEENGNEVYRGGIPGKLAAPLAKRQQDRLDRSAAYEESKKELSKWIETVKQNRRAEHLSFPLVDPNAAAAMNSKQLGPTSKSQPLTSLESTIQEIMKESGLASNDQQSQEIQEQAFEELQERDKPLEEVQARRAELRRARDLMFREEIRARRLKKIKSKAFRRVHRKEREKADQQNRSLLAAQGLLDSEDDRELNDRRRAEERMGARHRESKWAKSVKMTGRAAWDEDARHGVTDLARRDEDLRRRIEGRIGGGSDESESEESESDAFSETDDGRHKLQSRLDQLEHEDVESAVSRLGSMAFMKRAEAARKAANDQEIHRLRQSLRGDDQESADEADSDSETPVGRQKFGLSTNGLQPTAAVPIDKSEFEERGSVDEREEFDYEGPGSEAIVEASANVAAPKLCTKPNPSAPAAEIAQHSQLERKSTSRTIPPAGPRKMNTPAKKKGSKIPQSNLEDMASEHESEGERDDQAALAQAIFAGPDDAEQDFAKEKEQTAKEEGDQIVDNSLPGWGSWAGEGVSKKAQKRAKGRFITTIKGVAQDKRQDARLEKVIINEKRVKKNAKYLATELPHPFDSRQQYERSLRLPLGPEWTTKSTFQDSTKPRVLIKQGVIRPMARPLV